MALQNSLQTGRSACLSMGAMMKQRVVQKYVMLWSSLKSIQLVRQQSVITSPRKRVAPCRQLWRPSSRTCSQRPVVSLTLPFQSSSSQRARTDSPRTTTIHGPARSQLLVSVLPPEVSVFLGSRHYSCGDPPCIKHHCSVDLLSPHGCPRCSTPRAHS